MPQVYSRRQFGAALWPLLLGVTASGCGTILYPERRGQPAGRLDWGVVALDGIGLLLFFIPGVIAFAVDFSTGAIYLPYDGYGKTDSGQPSQLRRIDVPRRQLTREGIARIVSYAVGQSFTLAQGTYQTRPLVSLEAFWQTREEIAAASPGLKPPFALRAQSPAK